MAGKFKVKGVSMKAHKKGRGRKGRGRKGHAKRK